MRHITVRSAVLTAMFALVVPVAARAQVAIKGGVSFSDASNTGALPGNPKDRSGYDIGLALQPSGPIGFGIEGLWARRGLDNANVLYARQTDYVDIPAYLEVRLPIAGLSPFAYAGPQASYELQCKTGSVTCPTTDASKWSYAGVIGAGLRMNSGLSLEGRYVYGLSNLNYSTVTSSASYKTRSFLVLAGFAL